MTETNFDTRLNPILEEFIIAGIVKSISPFGSGHINDTYKVETDQRNYLLQRINHSIFQNVEGLTGNIIAVTQYLDRVIQSSGDRMQTLQCIQTKTKEYLVKTEKGEYWRVFDFIENSKSYDQVLNADLAYEGGKAYGWFVKVLGEFPSEELVDTIPDFHNASSRIKSFKQVVDADVVERVADVRELVDFLLERADSMLQIHKLGEERKIPIRVTHNDTKINNVLFDENNRGFCVIDLDTVMPGFVHFDFGDAIRTFTNNAAEDEKDSSRIAMNMEYFEAFTKGFLSQTKDILTSEEISSLAFSAKYITYEQSIRFLTDYLQGDTYYKISYPDHNLFRAAGQAQLLKSMEINFPAMEGIVSRYS